MSDDIVARLRAVLHNDRSVELMNREAADEIERLRNGGCARDQTTTQFCEEAVFLQGELDTSRKRCRDLMIRQGELDAEIRKLRSEVG